MLPVVVTAIVVLDGLGELRQLIQACAVDHILSFLCDRQPHNDLGLHVASKAGVRSLPVDRRGLQPISALLCREARRLVP